MYKYYYNTLLYHWEHHSSKSSLFQNQFLPIRRCEVDRISYGTWKNDQINEEGLDIIRKAIVELRPKYRQMLYEYYFAGHTMAQMGKKWGYSKERIRQYLSKSLRRLEEVVKNS